MISRAKFWKTLLKCPWRKWAAAAAAAARGKDHVEKHDLINKLNIKMQESYLNKEVFASIL